MAHPCTDPLYLLAFDHRDFFLRELVGQVGPPTAEQTAVVADAKRLISVFAAARTAAGVAG